GEAREVADLVSARLLWSGQFERGAPGGEGRAQVVPFRGALSDYRHVITGAVGPRPGHREDLPGRDLGGRFDADRGRCHGDWYGGQGTPLRTAYVADFVGPRLHRRHQVKCRTPGCEGVAEETAWRRSFKRDDHEVSLPVGSLPSDRDVRAGHALGGRGDV